MFEEYVEHASDPPALSPPPRSLPQLHYEGFESAPYPEDEFSDDAAAGFTAFETGFVSGGVQPEYEPIFELAGVQHTLPAALVSLTVSSNVLTMAFKSNTLQQLSLTNSDAIANVTLAKKGDYTIYKVFSDPTGKHVIIATHQGENFYLYEGWPKAQHLPRCKLIIESVAWNPQASFPSTTYPRTSTREILLGGRNGTIYEMLIDAHTDVFKPYDRYVSPVYHLPDRQPITGLHSEFLTSGNRVFVLATSPSRIYQFVGMVDRRPDEVGKLYDSMFSPYRDAAPKFLELPGATLHSELHVSTVSMTTRTMAWLTAQGIYHGALNLAATGSDIIDSASLLPYPYPNSSTSPASSPKASSASVPLSILVTDFHFLLLYPDRVCAVSSLDEKLVYEELLALKPNEKPIALASDPINKTYWVYTNASILEIPVRNESRDVWKVYLKRGQHDIALQYAKAPAQRALVNAALADKHFQDGKFIQAAQCYAQSSRGFEEVALAFADAGENDALRYFLVCRLERLPKTMTTQRMMLATWLVEFYLGKLNTLDDLVASESASQDVDNLRTERSMIEDELRQFFETYKTNLHQQTVYELILSHGRTDVFLHYATIIGDFERVVQHYVMNEEWLKAVDVLNKQSDRNLYYRFSPVLMRHAPKETVDSWLRQSSLDPHKLIPALLQSQHAPTSPLTPNHAVRYLNYLVFNAGSTSPMIHNLLLTFLAASPTRFPPSSPSSTSKLSNRASGADEKPVDSADRPLLRFLSTAPTDPLTLRPYYDLDYALRLCKRNNRLQACVHIYAQMGMWEESVELALGMGELELARINADRPEDDEVLRRKLWLMVAKYVVQDKKDIKTAMRFLDNTNVLKIEDILPFFPDFVVIDDFKDEICTALEGYSAHIDSLKSEMNDATKTAENIKRDMAELKNRFVTVEQSDKCATCELPLLTREFYVFPCHHSFHADCLIGQAKEYLPSHTLRRIILLQDELVQLTTSPPAVTGPNLPPPPNPPAAPAAQQRGLLSANFGNGIVARTVAAPAVVGRNVFAAAGAGLRDLIIPESLANAISGNISLNLNMNLGLNPWGGAGAGEGPRMSPARMREKAEKLREELDLLLASGCPLCESVVAGLDKPFVVPGEGDRSWDL